MILKYFKIKIQDGDERKRMPYVKSVEDITFYVSSTSLALTCHVPELNKLNKFTEFNLLSSN